MTIGRAIIALATGAAAVAGVSGNVNGNEECYNFDHCDALGDGGSTIPLGSMAIAGTLQNWHRSCETDTPTPSNTASASVTATASPSPSQTPSKAPELFIVSELPDELTAVFGKDRHPHYVNVFGVNVVGQAGAEETDVLHVANILAQFMDTDMDGEPDIDPLLSSDTTTAGFLASRHFTLVVGPKDMTDDQVEDCQDKFKCFDDEERSRYNMFRNGMTADDGTDSTSEYASFLSSYVFIPGDDVSPDAFYHDDLDVDLTLLNVATRIYAAVLYRDDAPAQSDLLGFISNITSTDICEDDICSITYNDQGDSTYQNAACVDFGDNDSCDQVCQGANTMGFLTLLAVGELEGLEQCNAFVDTWRIPNFEYLKDRFPSFEFELLGFERFEDRTIDGSYTSMAGAPSDDIRELVDYYALDADDGTDTDTDTDIDTDTDMDLGAIDSDTDADTDTDTDTEV